MRKPGVLNCSVLGRTFGAGVSLVVIVTFAPLAKVSLAKLVRPPIAPAIEPLSWALVAHVMPPPKVAQPPRMPNGVQNRR